MRMFSYCTLLSFKFQIDRNSTRDTIVSMDKLVIDRSNLVRKYNVSYITIKYLWGNPKIEFPRTGLDRTKTSSGSGHIFENIFGLGRNRDFGPVRVKVFFTGVSYIFSENFENKVELNGNHASHSQPELSTARDTD